MSDTGEIKDHQSRIIECGSWDDYIKAFQEYNGNAIAFRSLTSMIGASINREKKIVNLQFDDFHMSCFVYGYPFNCHTKHLAYLIN